MNAYSCIEIEILPPEKRFSPPIRNYDSRSLLVAQNTNLGKRKNPSHEFHKAEELTNVKYIEVFMQAILIAGSI
jgi:hypothetical protein